MDAGKKKEHVYYDVEIGDGVVYDIKKFTKEVAEYLDDPKGWKSRGYVFHLVNNKQDPRFTIILTSPKTLKSNGCKDDDLSCAILNGGKVWINAMRWTRGAKKSKLALKDYRQYVISHEVGHALGYDHVNCPAEHAPAPIMMQQTRGIGECEPNTALTPADNKKA